MKKSRFTDQQIAFALQQAEAGTPVAEVCRKMGVPYQIHTVLTDNGVQFTNRACDRYALAHIFDRVCEENGIEHRLKKVNHPWTTDEVEQPFLRRPGYFVSAHG